ncbi:hypothetical protein [Absidia glauca]|uniref:Uncharacterized protein n=1 Tax=Absidia glauca TaxID=4829 RepID=A0A163V846_ABSGL|nr:hypothetical protein [Absidia glauca]
MKQWWSRHRRHRRHRRRYRRRHRRSESSVEKKLKDYDNVDGKLKSDEEAKKKQKIRVDGSPDFVALAGFETHHQHFLPTVGGHAPASTLGLQ